MVVAGSIMDKVNKVLEVVSDSEKGIVIEDSEHEEGEISEDDDDLEYPGHFASGFCKERGGKAPSTSAVVIYDDHGRTAIFTSPKKESWPRQRYARRTKPVQRWAKEANPKAQKEDTRKASKSGGRRWQDDDAHSKKSKYVAANSKKAKGDWSERDLPPRRSGGAQHKRDDDWTSSSDSDSCCSCSSSSSTNDSPRSQRGKGKENKKTREKRSRSLSGNNSKKRSVARKSPERFTGRSPHKKSPVHSYNKNYSKTTPATSPPKKKLAAEGFEDVSKFYNEGKLAEVSGKGEVPLITNQKQLPRGSFGEMLLKKTLKGKLKVMPQTVKSSESEQEKTENKDVELQLEPVCYTLDQEDEDELQLRLIALQSSLKVLSDVRMEGCQNKSLSFAKYVNTSQENKISDDLSTKHLDADIVLFKDVNIEETRDNLEIKYANEDTTRISNDVLMLDQENTSHTKEVKINNLELLDDVSQSSTRSRPSSASAGMDLELNGISTNKSYLDDSEDTTRQLATNIEQQLHKDIKDAADSNQDLIDMDICDSSPEDDGNNTENKVLKDVENDDIEKNNSVPNGSVNPFVENSQNTMDSNRSDSYSNVNQNNFQIPVEWAYMMPPPPPPDQPANDISNINNWCYDQNMYLQTMQSSYEAQEQYQHYPGYDGTSEWGPAQQQTSQWVDSLQNAESYEKTDCSQEGHNLDVTTSKPDTFDANEVPTHMYGNDDNGEMPPEPNLKDMPAEQYQAFMSAVLNQQNNQNSNSQRNLIEVKLTGGHKSVKSEGSCASSNPNLKSVTLMQHENKKEKQKLKRNRKRVRKRSTRKAANEDQVGAESQGSGDVSAALIDDDDEDLLRAQLLIDLSRKKQQKKVVKDESGVVSTYGALKSAKTASLRESVVRGEVVASAFEYDSSSPQMVPSSAESSPRIRPVIKTSLIKHHRHVRENSPKLSGVAHSRHKLSDIGGFGLDPKNRFDYLPKDSQKDLPKLKYPQIKPVIINLQSDSDDSEDDGVGKSEEVRQGCSSHEASDSTDPVASGSGSQSGGLISSIDLLLKSMRNADIPEADTHGKKGVEMSKQLAKAKTLTVEQGAVMSSHLKKQNIRKPVIDTTPNIVRHLSRRQQVEYRKLKEQLREKELRRQQLLKRKMMNSKIVVKVSNVPLNAKEEVSEVNEATMENKTREVSVMSKGLLQIQVANNTQNETIVKECDSKGDSDSVAHPSDNEDEEMLRLMVLKTLQKKDINDEKVEEAKITKETESSLKSLRVVINQDENNVTGDQDNIGSAKKCRIILEENLESRLKGNAEGIEDVDCSEWMVVDEVMDDLDGKNKVPDSESELASASVTDEQESTMEDVEARTEEEVSSQAETLSQCSDGESSEATEHITSYLDSEHEVNSKLDSKSVPDLNTTEDRESVVSNTDAEEKRPVSDENTIKDLRIEANIQSNNNGIVTEQSGCVNKQEGEELDKLRENPQNIHHINEAETLQENATITNICLDSNIGNTSQTLQPNGVGKTSGVIRTLDFGHDKSSIREDIESTNVKVNISNNNSTSAAKDTGAIPTIVPCKSDSKSTNVKAQGDANTALKKPLRTKRLLLLKRVEQQYIHKRNSMNEVISQLAVLVQEATDEERQRQALRTCVAKLRHQLLALDTQLQDKSNNLKHKMSRIRNMQTKISKEREELNTLERKGEVLGKEELGSNYKLPKVLGSPRSVSKDHQRKKLLADNISALRQQLGHKFNKAQDKVFLASKRIGTTKNLDNTTGSDKQMLKTVKKIKSHNVSKKVSSQTAGGTDGSPNQRTNMPGKVTLPVQEKSGKRQMTDEAANTASKVAKVDCAAPIPLQKKASNIPSGEPQVRASPDDNATCRIDEMNMLCPYDLLGRCNDDSCSYQHLRRQVVATTNHDAKGTPGASISNETDAESCDKIQETGIRVYTSLVQESGKPSSKPTPDQNDETEDAIAVTKPMQRTDAETSNHSECVKIEKKSEPPNDLTKNTPSHEAPDDVENDVDALRNQEFTQNKCSNNEEENLKSGRDSSITQEGLDLGASKNDPNIREFMMWTSVCLVSTFLCMFFLHSKNAVHTEEAKHKKNVAIKTVKRRNVSKDLSKGNECLTNETSKNKKTKIVPESGAASDAVRRVTRKRSAAAATGGQTPAKKTVTTRTKKKPAANQKKRVTKR